MEPPISGIIFTVNSAMSDKLNSFFKCSIAQELLWIPKFSILSMSPSQFKAEFAPNPLLYHHV